MTPHGSMADALAMHRLARDLERIACGQGPSADDLARAPVLRDWKLGWVPAPVLVGTLAGHPDVQAGLALTSQLYALDAEHSLWARTKNRWYVLAPDGASQNG